MKFTAPVIAAISAGSLVLLSLIVCAILYTRGFFDSGKEPEKPNDPNHPKSNPKDDFNKAVDDVATHLTPTICAGLKSGTLATGGIEVQKWFSTSLVNMEDKAVLEKILTALNLGFKIFLEEAKKCIDDNDALKKATDKTEVFLQFGEKLADHIIKVFKIADDIQDDGQSMKDFYATFKGDADIKRIAGKLAEFEKCWDEHADICKKL